MLFIPLSLRQFFQKKLPNQKMLMYLLIYNFVVQLYHFVANILALFQPKSKKWVKGRQDLFQKLTLELETKELINQPFIWFHCASLGEFEQGRPLIERIKKEYPDEKILLTFFSPSGYEIRKNYAFADIVCYLPLDTKLNAKRFLDLVEPTMVFWIKYEFWFNILAELHYRKIPTFLVSGIFRADHFFFSPFGKWHRKCLNFFTHLFVQNQVSATHLEAIGFSHLTISGDTRLDRVLDIAKENKQFELLEKFKAADDRPIIICGSTWQPDEAIITQFINENSTNLPFRFIIAPHEIKVEKIANLVQNIEVKVTRYSTTNLDEIGKQDVLIIDNIGMLSALYKYGKIAYIGGAFGSGLHNILEPIVFGLPVIFGSKYQKFEEALNLVEQKGCFSIKNYKEFCKIIEFLNQEKNYTNASAIVTKYVKTNKGATPKILSSKAVGLL
jgi:3-deoxy-D-manno-octulosonic-acid transferase